jgi:hypothetical protein
LSGPVPSALQVLTISPSQNLLPAVHETVVHTALPLESSQIWPNGQYVLNVDAVPVALHTWMLPAPQSVPPGVQMTGEHRPPSQASPDAQSTGASNPDPSARQVCRAVVLAHETTPGAQSMGTQALVFGSQKLPAAQSVSPSTLVPSELQVPTLPSLHAKLPGVHTCATHLPATQRSPVAQSIVETTLRPSAEQTPTFVKVESQLDVFGVQTHVWQDALVAVGAHEVP